MSDSDSDKSSSEKDEGANEPYHARLRRTVKSPLLVILSSDSDQDCNLVEDESNSQPSETEGETSVKVEKCSEDENSPRKEKQSTKKGEEGETSKVEESIAVNENLKSKTTLSLRRNSGQNNSSPRGETSKSRVPKSSLRRNCPRWCNSYYKRKKILAQKSSKGPLKRPRKYFNRLPNKKYVRKGGHYAISKKPPKRKSIDSNVQSDTPENQDDEEEEEEHSEVDSKSASPSQKPPEEPVRRRGRSRLIPGVTLKKKRGRPKLSEAEVLLRNKQKARALATQGIVKQVIAKRRGRPKASETEDVVKKKGRPKLQRNDMGEIIPSHGHMHAKARTFVQHLNCLNGAIRLPKCRECRKASYTKSNWDMASSYCRFLEYRKLFAARSGTIHSAGFLQPSDSTEYDRRLWLPKLGEPPEDLTIDTATELLIQVGDQFCNLVQQEKEALGLHIGSGKSMTWKKLVQGIREMCDVCDTTLFNIHWVCPKCGLAVCIDCYKVRKQGVIIEDEESQMRGRDDYMWLFCHNRLPHEQDKLIMAQMVPGDILWAMNDTMHKVREKWNIAAHCKCSHQANISQHKTSIDTGICKELLSNVSKSFADVALNKPYHKRRPLANELSHLNINIPNCGSKWLQGMSEDDASFESILEETFNSGSKSGRMPSYICHDVIIPVDDAFPTPVNDDCNETFKALSFSALMKGLEESEPEHNENDVINTLKLFNSRYPQPSRGGEPLPLRIFTSIESDLPFKGIPHSWLCNGRLLLLHRPDHRKNIELFQEQWKRGQPIMVMAVDEKLDMSLWHPDGFCRDFGDIENDLVNCKTGTVIPNLPMKKFWLGFENFDKRMKDDAGEYMLLKLKDWPPGEDFSEKLPTRFHDLMKGLPLPEYTHRDGIFNLAGRLPSWFVRPDLGPKMYNAYGSALYPTKGTTNLHLDISDAVNVMVYVGIPHDGKDEDHIIEALKAIDEGGCDSLMRERVRSKGVRPGALWHIYDSRSVDKIRTFLTKVAIERGEKLEAHHDPIHDQSWYLDAELRRRLYVEYGVQGYAIAQCLGDAVFIPAGAPHQVRNLHSCVKVAEDFVSPENIAHCFKLTQEFRHLSDTHTNHEDKLQIKNIIYHVVKDALSHLLDERDDFCSFLKEL